MLLTVAVLALGVALVLVAVLVTRAVHAPVSASVDQSVPGPVLVVPGYGAGPGSVSPLVDELRREGRSVTVLQDPGGGTGDLRAQGARLADLARRTMTAQGAASVDLVGYSAGGVVARVFVRDDGGASVVRRVLTVGSPHHGTDVAVLAQDLAGSCPAACEQLATGSDLLRRLDAGDETPPGPRWTTVRSSFDQVVVPVDSAALGGALNLSVQDLCPAARTSHDGLPGDPAVLATLRTALGVALPHRPAQVSC